MGNDEKVLFDAVLKHFTDTYRLTIEYPYDDECMQIRQGNQIIGILNPIGHNLLYCLKTLLDMLRNELR